MILMTEHWSSFMSTQPEGGMYVQGPRIGEPELNEIDALEFGNF